MTLRSVRTLLLTVLIAGSIPLAAQTDACGTSSDLSAFVRCRLRILVARDTQVRDFGVQSEGQSLADNSTSLVDTTTASSVATVSTTLSALSSKSRTPNSTDVNNTVSLYALSALIRRIDPLNADFFSKEWALRKLSILLSDSFPSDKGATADQGSRTYGAKYLLFAGRDLSTPENANKANAILAALEAEIPIFARSYQQVAEYLFTKKAQLGGDFITATNAAQIMAFAADTAKFHEMLKNLTPEDARIIDLIIGQVVPSERAVVEASKRTEEDVLSAIQWTAAFSAKISKGNGNNTYRTELVQDKQFAVWLKETMNIGWDFINTQKPSATNRQVGRLALQTETPLNGYKNRSPRIPLALVLSGEGNWGSNGTPIYKGQAKLKVTVLTGIDVPLVFSFANRTTGVPRADIKGQVTIAVDFAKVAKAFKKSGG